MTKLKYKLHSSLCIFSHVHWELWELHYMIARCFPHQSSLFHDSVLGWNIQELTVLYINDHWISTIILSSCLWSNPLFVHSSPSVTSDVTFRCSIRLKNHMIEGAFMDRFLSGTNTIKNTERQSDPLTRHNMESGWHAKPTITENTRLKLLTILLFPGGKATHSQVGLRIMKGYNDGFYQHKKVC